MYKYANVKTVKPHQKRQALMLIQMNYGWFLTKRQLSKKYRERFFKNGFTELARPNYLVYLGEIKDYAKEEYNQYKLYRKRAGLVYGRKKCVGGACDE